MAVNVAYLLEEMSDDEWNFLEAVSLLEII